MTTEELSNEEKDPALRKAAVSKSFFGEWVNANKKPRKEELVLVICEGWCVEGAELATYENGEWISTDGAEITEYVSHWCRLPKPPKNVC